MNGCVPIRQSMERGTLFGESPGSFNEPPGEGPGSAPVDNTWQSQMEGVASWYGPAFNGRLTASG
ncbi:MAG: hypothetical protein ACREL1_03380, partial [bacterium]